MHPHMAWEAWHFMHESKIAIRLKIYPVRTQSIDFSYISSVKSHKYIILRYEFLQNGTRGFNWLQARCKMSLTRPCGWSVSCSGTIFRNCTVSAKRMMYASRFPITIVPCSGQQTLDFELVIAIFDMQTSNSAASGCAVNIQFVLHGVSLCYIEHHMHLRAGYNEHILTDCARCWNRYKIVLTSQTLTINNNPVFISV